MCKPDLNREKGDGEGRAPDMIHPFEIFWVERRKREVTPGTKRRKKEDGYAPRYEGRGKGEIVSCLFFVIVVIMIVHKESNSSLFFSRPRQLYAPDALDEHSCADATHCVGYLCTLE